MVPAAATLAHTCLPQQIPQRCPVERAVRDHAVIGLLLPVTQQALAE